MDPLLQVENLAEAGDPLAVLQAMHDLPHTEPGGGGPHEQNGDAAADPLQRVESVAEASDVWPRSRPCTTARTPNPAAPFPLKKKPFGP